MRRVRRAYYDRFARFYDRFVAMHSHDAQGLARTFLASLVPARNTCTVLDVCTGTASLLPHVRTEVGRDGRIIGMDFSHGMLRMAQHKTRGLPNVYLVEAEAGQLPFAAGAFDAVTCSHAFYELKGEHDKVLQEVVRVLKPTGTFLMMEHDVPSNPFVKGLFYLRLALIGGAPAGFLRREREILERHFGAVEKLLAPAGKSKGLPSATVFAHMTQTARYIRI